MRLRNVRTTTAAALAPLTAPAAAADPAAAAEVRVTPGGGRSPARR
jgi:uncharacterized membrane protein